MALGISYRQSLLWKTKVNIKILEIEEEIQTEKVQNRIDNIDPISGREIETGNISHKGPLTH